MNKNKLFLLSLLVIMTLVFTTAVFAEPENQYSGGNYCTGVNCAQSYNYNYGYYYGGTTSCASTAYQAEFVTDVNYPDGTYVAPGQKFTKTWRLRNTGTACWGTGTYLVFTGGDSMGGTSVPIPYMVCPKQSVDISVNLVAPSTQGTASGQWKLQAPDGLIFGVGCGGQTPIWVNISTWSAQGSTNCYCAGQANCSCMPCYGSNCSPTGSRGGKNPYCNNKIRSIKDMTVPDGSVVAPGTVFRKTWRMKNAGTCVWDENYMMVFAGGDNVGSSEFVRLNKWNILRGDGLYGKVAATKVYPGQWVEFSIDIKAPDTPGEYQAFYKLRDNYGYEFGYGPYADEAFWVKFTVSNSLTTSPSSKDALPAGNSTIVSKSVNLPEEDDVEVLIPDVIEIPTEDYRCEDMSLALSQTDDGYNIIWSVTNGGSSTWEDVRLLASGGNKALSVDENGFEIPTTASGESAKISFPITLDESLKSEDALYMEFYLSTGSEKFCKFYFEAPEN